MDLMVLFLLVLWCIFILGDFYSVWVNLKLFIGSLVVILMLASFPLIGYFSPPTITTSIEVVNSYHDLKFPCFVQIQVKTYDYRFSMLRDKEERTLVMSCINVDTKE